MKKLFLITICALFLLPSCDFFSISSGDDLLQAPILNQQQKAVSDALAQTMNVNQIQYKYPTAGSYQSPFVLFDLDQDGMLEALIFYSDISSPNQVRMKVLQQDSAGNWLPFADLPGSGDQVQFLSFEHLVSPDYYNIVISWYNSETHVQTITVYTMADNQIFTEIESNYNDFLLIDNAGKQTKDILIIGRSSPDTFNLFWYSSLGNRLISSSLVELNPNVTNILQVLGSPQPDGSILLYIDEALQEADLFGSTYATEIFSLSDSDITTIAGTSYGLDSEEYVLYRNTFRADPVLSISLFQDNTVQIPQMENLPGTTDSPGSSEQPAVRLTEFLQLEEGALVSKYRAIVNEQENYLLFLPERWMGQILVYSNPELRQWTIYKMDSETGSAKDELLRIYSETVSDTSSSGADLSLGTFGAFSYYAYISFTVNEPLAVTPEEVQTMFLYLDHAL